MGDRGYLGLSEIGMCQRRVCYVRHPDYAHLGEMSPQRQRVCDIGTVLEPFVLDWYGEFAGVDVVQKQYEVELGACKGHIDGYIQSDGGAVIDSKTSTSFTIGKWKKDGLPRQIIFQQNGYVAGMLKSGYPCAKAIIVALDRVDGDITVFNLEPAKEIMTAVVARSMVLDKAIREGTLLDREYERESSECRYCPFKAACWADADSAMRDATDALDATNLPEYDELCENYYLGGEMEEQGKEMQEASKSKIIGLMKQNKANMAWSHSYTTKVKWIEQDKVDMKAIRENEPDVWGKYRKQIKFPRFTVEKL